MPANTRYILAAFAVIVLAGIISGFRVDRLARWDSGPTTTTLDLAEAEPETGAPAEAMRSRRLGHTEASPHNVEVKVCSAGTQLDAQRDIELRLVEADAPDSTSGQELTSLAQARTVWSVEPLSSDELIPPVESNCLLFSQRAEGRGEIALVWTPGAFDDLASPELVVESSVRRPLGLADRAVVLLMLVGSVLFLIAGQRTRPNARVPWQWWHGFAVLGALFLVSIVAGSMPLDQTGAHLANLLVMLSYVAVTLVAANQLLPGDPLAALAFHAVERKVWIKSALFGIGLAIFLAFSLTLLPSGESHMTRLLQSSAGIMAVLTLAVLAPLTEELLLRGVVYTSIERTLGPISAVVISSAIFSLLHLGQHLGHLWPWLVVTCVGVALSLVRYWSGSCLASAVSHMTYNLFIAAPALIAG